jgi:PHD/YefM family antitoxin component YafN of YafNO toxin-antitoxin module
MKGIRYVVDDDGQKTAVVIDLKQYGELWEDLYDALTAAQRQHEPRESLTQVKRRLQS